MGDLFSASNPQPMLGFPESLTESYKPREISAFVGLAKHKAILTKLAAAPRKLRASILGRSRYAAKLH